MKMGVIVQGYFGEQGVYVTRGSASMQQELGKCERPLLVEALCREVGGPWSLLSCRRSAPGDPVARTGVHEQELGQ